MGIEAHAFAHYIRYVMLCYVVFYGGRVHILSKNDSQQKNHETFYLRYYILR